jgi:hypothetical protein
MGVLAVKQAAKNDTSRKVATLRLLVLLAVDALCGCQSRPGNTLSPSTANEET